MKIYDMHIHTYAARPLDRAALLSALDEAGVYGACIFSEQPVENWPGIGIRLEERLEQLLSLVEGAEDRLLPVLFVHPYERGIVKKLAAVKERGIVAIKVMANNFEIGERKSMRLFHAAAELDLPVILHSGVLYDGCPSSRCNRPASFEPLFDVKHLRFSMGHCSWPWIDECIAVYGKLRWLSAYYGRTAEMFLDLTPGTPPIYRRELLTKLHAVTGMGSLLFGTDHISNRYNAARTRELIAADNAIYDELGVSEAERRGIYRDNLARFLGRPLAE